MTHTGIICNTKERNFEGITKEFLIPGEMSGNVD